MPALLVRGRFHLDLADTVRDLDPHSPPSFCTVGSVSSHQRTLRMSWNMTARPRTGAWIRACGYARYRSRSNSQWTTFWYVQVLTGHLANHLSSHHLVYQ